MPRSRPARERLLGLPRVSCVTEDAFHSILGLGLEYSRLLYLFSPFSSLSVGDLLFVGIGERERKYQEQEQEALRNGKRCTHVIIQMDQYSASFYFFLIGAKRKRAGEHVFLICPPLAGQFLSLG